MLNLVYVLEDIPKDLSDLLKSARTNFSIWSCIESALRILKRRVEEELRAFQCFYKHDSMKQLV